MCYHAFSASALAGRDNSVALSGLPLFHPFELPALQAGLLITPLQGSLFRSR